VIIKLYLANSPGPKMLKQTISNHLAFSLNAWLRQFSTDIDLNSHG